MRGGWLAVLTLLGAAPLGAALSGPVIAAEQNAPASQKKAALPTVSSVQHATGSFGASPIPAELLVPVAQFPAELMAPSAANWMMSPTQERTAGQRFAVWSPPAAVTKPDIAPVAQKAAKEPKTAARASVPLPPRRPALLTSAAQQEASLQPSTAPQISEAEQEADAPPLPAARPVSTSTKVTAAQAPAHIEVLIQRHAERFDVPATLVRRVAWRESKFDPKQRNGPYWGLMQIRVDTARGLGFRGQPTDLLDADTNMTYAVAYLANAYKVAGRNETRAVALYSRGYYYGAKRKGLLGALIKTASVN